MGGTFLSYTTALAAAVLSGWALYMAAPRQRLLARPIPLAAAASVALLLLAVGVWLMSGLIGPAPGFFAMLAAWMSALVGAPWLTAVLVRRRQADGA